MADASSGETDDVWSVGRHCVTGLRIVLDSGLGRLRDTKDVRPLLDFLSVVGVVEGGVAGSTISYKIVGLDNLKWSLTQFRAIASSSGESRCSQGRQHEPRHPVCLSIYACLINIKEKLTHCSAV